jgi:hypothetical protein
MGIETALSLSALVLLCILLLNSLGFVLGPARATVGANFLLLSHLFIQPAIDAVLMKPMRAVWRFRGRARGARQGAVLARGLEAKLADGACGVGRDAFPGP